MTSARRARQAAPRKEEAEKVPPKRQRQIKGSLANWPDAGRRTHGFANIRRWPDHQPR